MSAPPVSVNVQPPPIPMTVNVAPPPGDKKLMHWDSVSIQFQTYVARVIEWEIIFMIFTLLSCISLFSF